MFNYFEIEYDIMFVGGMSGWGFLIIVSYMFNYFLSNWVIGDFWNWALKWKVDLE